MVRTRRPPNSRRNTHREITCSADRTWPPQHQQGIQIRATKVKRRKTYLAPLRPTSGVNRIPHRHHQTDHGQRRRVTIRKSNWPQTELQQLPNPHLFARTQTSRHLKCNNSRHTTHHRHSPRSPTSGLQNNRGTDGTRRLQHHKQTLCLSNTTRP